MRSLSSAAIAALASGHVVLATLVKMQFPGGTIALNSSNMDLAWNGDTYLAAAGLGDIDPISDRPGDMPGMRFTLQKVDASLISLALDDRAQVQGTPIAIYTAILDNATYQIVEVETDWVGLADTMPITEDGKTATITLTAESKAVDLLRGQSLTYTDAAQKTQYTADRAFEYVPDQANKPVVWPTREWFFK
jgi:hypothetical protein